MRYYKVFKHSKNCHYIHDCYRLEANNPEHAIELLKAKKGITGDYAQLNVGNWDHPNIIDVD